MRVWLSCSDPIPDGWRYREKESVHQGCMIASVMSVTTLSVAAAMTAVTVSTAWCAFSLLVSSIKAWSP